MDEKMKYIYLIIIYMGLNNIITGQDSVFTIQSFKPENIRESQVLIRIYDYYYRSSGETNKLDDPIGNNENDGLRTQFITSINWKFKYETPNILLYTNVFPSFEYRFGRSDYSSEVDNAIPEQPIHSLNERKSRSKDLQESINITLLGSRYIVNKFGLMVHSDMSFTLSQNDSYRKSEDVSFNTNENYLFLNQRYREKDIENSGKRVSTGVMFGPIYGKVYEGFYAAKAIELISELSEKGQLISKPSANQMKQLARIIYEEMNRYFYDSRIKRIESLERITAFLVSENILSELISTYLTILDIYQYSNAKFYPRFNTWGYLPNQLYKRPHGLKIGVLLGGAYSESNYENKGFSTDMYYRTEYDSLWQIVGLDTVDRSDPYDEKKISNGSGSKGILFF